MFVVEAEALLPPVEATDPAEPQGSCCGVRWSSDAQLWFRSDAPGDTITVTFEAPSTGTYDLSAVQTQAPDYGVNTLAVDGRELGGTFDGYNAGGVALQRASYGTVQLDEGRHTLTFTVTGKNAASGGFLVGVDKIELDLLS